MSTERTNFIFTRAHVRADRAQKMCDDKPELDLLPYDALALVAEAFTVGNAKYGKHDWRKGQDFTKFAAAALRHITKWLDGTDRDPESGVHHLGHASANLLMILQWVAENTGTDDRYTPDG